MSFFPKSKNKKGNLKIVTVSMYISTILFLASTVIFPRVFNMEGEYALYINILKVIAILYNFLLFLFHFKLKKSTFILIYFAVVLSIFILNVSFLNFLAYVLVLVAYSNNRKSFKIYFITKSILVLIIFVMGINGLNSEYIINEDGRSIRQTFGFTNPNTAGMMIFDLLLLSFYLYTNKKMLIFCSLIIVFFVYYYTDSRTFGYVSFVFFIFIFISPRLLKKLKPIIINTFIIFFICTLLFALLHDTSFNGWLSRRPEMMYNFLNYHQLNLFGYSRQGLDISVDNSYLRILIELGVLYFVIHIFIIRKVFKYLFIKNDYMGVRIVIAIMIYDIFEQFTIAHGSILLLFISKYLIEKNKEIKEKKLEIN